MWNQVHGVQKIVGPITANATDGVNLICFSQGMHPQNYCKVAVIRLLLLVSHPGGVLCRGFLEAYPDHNVKTFISLSAPLAGQFGGWYNKGIVSCHMLLFCI